MVVLLYLRVDCSDGGLHFLMVNVAVIRLWLDGLGSRSLGGRKVVWTLGQLLVVLKHSAVLSIPVLVLAFAGIFDPFPLKLESALIVRMLWPFVLIRNYLSGWRIRHGSKRCLRFCGGSSDIILVHRVRLGFFLVDELGQRPCTLASHSWAGKSVSLLSDLRYIKLVLFLIIVTALLIIMIIFIVLNHLVALNLLAFVVVESDLFNDPFLLIFLRSHVIGQEGALLFEVLHEVSPWWIFFLHQVDGRLLVFIPAYIGLVGANLGHLRRVEQLLLVFFSLFHQLLFLLLELFDHLLLGFDVLVLIEL